MTKIKTINAFFIDFDKTIIKKDSMLLFLWFYVKKNKLSVNFFLDFFSFIFSGLMYILDFDEKTTNVTVKNKLFRTLRYESFDEMVNDIDEFFDFYFDKILHSEFLELTSLYNRKHFYIISASPDVFIQRFIKRFSFKHKNVIISGYGSNYEFIDGSLVVTKNLKGRLKGSLVRHISTKQKYAITFGIGDDKSDKHMIEACSNGILSKKPLSKFLGKYYAKIIK